MNDIHSIILYMNVIKIYRRSLWENAPLSPNKTHLNMICVRNSLACTWSDEMMWIKN